MTLSKLSWRWILPPVLVVLAGLGWLLVGHFEKPPASAAATAPAPAVGVRPAALKGVNQSFEFVGRINTLCGH